MKNVLIILFGSILYLNANAQTNLAAGVSEETIRAISLNYRLKALKCEVGEDGDHCRRLAFEEAKNNKLYSSPAVQSLKPENLIGSAPIVLRSPAKPADKFEHEAYLSCRSGKYGGGSTAKETCTVVSQDPKGWSDYSIPADTVQ